MYGRGSVFVHRVLGHWVLGEPLVHAYHNHLIRRSCGLQIGGEPVELFSSKAFARSTDIVECDQVDTAFKIRGVRHLCRGCDLKAGDRQEVFTEFLHSVLSAWQSEHSQELDFVVSNDRVEGYIT